MKNVKEKILWIIIIILAIVFLGFEYSRVADFSIYLEAAADLLDGQNIYANLYGTSKVFPYMGSPTLAFLLSPLTFTSPVLAALFWKLINLFLLVRIWKLLEKYFQDFKLTQKQGIGLFLFSVFSMVFLLYRNFHMVQFTIFLLFTTLESIHQIRNKNQPALAALVLGLGIITKLLPIVMIPYLIYRGYLKSVLYLGIVLIVLIFLPATLLGWEANIFLYKEWLNSINPSSPLNVFDVSTRTVHGIAALISTLTIDGLANSHSLPIKRNIINLNPDVVSGIIVIVKLTLVLATLYFLRFKKIFADHSTKLNPLWELSYILLITPLIFPQQRSYAFLFIMPAMVYLVFGFIVNSKNRTPGILLLFGLSIILLNLDLLAGHFREYYWHFKTLTYGVLILLGLLTWMSPEKITR